MLYSLITKCRGCHAPADRHQEVLSMAPMPLAGMFCSSEEEARSAPIFPLTWVFCQQCGLVQVKENVSDAYLFSKYNYSSSTVGGLVRHFEGYAEFLKSRYGQTAGVKLLEIGCNDGVLLKRLPAAWNLIGCDPSDVAATAARNQSYRLLERPFNLDAVSGEKLDAAFDVISGSNCLAHISDLKEVFEAAWRALRPGGHLWIEVHDLHALLRGGQWDTIYHEHKVEWSEESLKDCLGRIGFVHRETIHIPMHGGALRVCFEKGGAPRTTEAQELHPPKALMDLRKAYEARYETEAARQLKATVGRGGRIAAYGAAGRANVYLNQMRELPFDYIVDESPLRLHKFIPQTATPIVSPDALSERPVDECLITAWNYRDDIIRKNPQHKGKWLTAFQDAG
jgi:SAM-dependent methyltransferase